ncbi:hypothetical protein GUJ93_ZPchr0008g11570 [Zizania palustris]|uniref:Uncharacterized protein n=1 Tax=Zizania palustris TaxID=103762 RepID=A0A8J5RB78_ZIZPA|nr:hypothetical protein GUJ93_ZPchr0008g11570 [Zizania palustris]
MAMAFYGSSFPVSHHQMLSFQSSPPDSVPAAPARLLPPKAAMPAPSSSTPPLPKYKFVTGSPADWAPHELAILKEGLLRYAHEPNITKYIKIAAMLQTRTIRDVALRCWWTTEKMVASTSGSSFQIALPDNTVPFSISMHHPGQNSLIHNEVPVLDSETRHLLEENNQLLSQIAENIETFKMVENTDLFLRTNNNITTVLKRMGETPGIMGQMPPLPVPVNGGSLNSLLQVNRMVAAYGVPCNSHMK